MIRHYYTLSVAAKNLDFLIGQQVSECFSQEKDTLVMELTNYQSPEYLIFSASPKLACFYRRYNFNKSRQNRIELFNELVGKRIISIGIIENERIIEIVFDSHKLYYFAFGGSRSNLILVANGIVKDSLNKSNILKGIEFKLPLNSLQSLHEFPPDTPIIKAIADCNFLLGKYYASELIYRNGWHEDAKLGSFDLKRIKSEMVNFRNECLNARKFYILGSEYGQYLLSLTKLRNYPKIVKEYDDVHQAILRRYVNSLKTDQSSREINKFNNLLTSSLTKATKNIEHILGSEKAEERISKYSLFGDLLSSYSEPKAVPGDSIELMDWSGNLIEIPLDPKKSIIANSIDYYDKARKIRDNQKFADLRLKKLISKSDKLQSLKIRFTQLKDYSRIDEFMAELKSISGIAMDDDKQEESRFRKFDLGEGYILYVGKNASNNDELTMKFAKAQDIWMHARGSAGSHAVLRMNSSAKVPKQILKKAAEIAAYYSQARNAKYVPVAYTFKKYVRKPKGANPGSVVMEREEVIMAEPKLPDNTESQV